MKIQEMFHKGFLFIEKNITDLVTAESDEVVLKPLDVKLFPTEQSCLSVHL